MPCFGPQKDEVIKSLAETLNEAGGIEFAFAKAGGSKFTQAKYFNEVTTRIIEGLLNDKEHNIAFLNGISLPKGLPRGEITTRATRNEQVTVKNIISFDLDLKDQHPYYNAFSSKKYKDLFDTPCYLEGDSLKKTKTRPCTLRDVESILIQKIDLIEEALGEPWIINFSGNGVHIHFRLKTLYRIESAKEYSDLYQRALEILEKITGLKFDPSCKNTGRIMRLPLTDNRKKLDNPVKTKVIYIGENSDSSNKFEALRGSEELFDTIKEEDKGAHKGKVKEALKRKGFRELLGVLGYSKSDTIEDRREGFLCSSPFSEDKSPSCIFDDSKGLWNDFSTGKGGDHLTLIAMVKGLSTSREDFPKVMEEAEKITGITPPKESPQEERDGTRKGGPAYVDYVPFFEKHLQNPRKDIFTQRLMTLRDGSWIPCQDNDNIAELESYAIDDGWLKKTHIKSHLPRFAATKKPEFLIDLPKWDGRDRIKEIASCVRTSNGSPELVEAMIKDWGSHAYRRMKDPKEQNRVLIFKGGQGKGKDTLIRVLVDGAREWSRNIMFDGNQKDLEMLITSSFFLKIGEFDRSATVSVSTFKDMVTKDITTLRKPYGREHMNYFVRSSFIGSSNVDDILRDWTGNRRFIIFDVEHIDWSYPNSEEDQNQVLAQYKHLAETGYKAPQWANDEMGRYISSQTPENPLEDALADFDERLTDMGKTKLSATIANSMISDIAMNCGIKKNKLKDALQRTGRKSRSTLGCFYHLPPIPIQKTEQA